MSRCFRDEVVVVRKEEGMQAGSPEDLQPAGIPPSTTTLVRFRGNTPHPPGTTSTFLFGAVVQTAPKSLTIGLAGYGQIILDKEMVAIEAWLHDQPLKQHIWSAATLLARRNSIVSAADEDECLGLDFA